MPDLFFVVSKLFWWLAAPGNVLLILLAAGTLLLMLGRRRIGLIATSSAVVALLAISILPVGTVLVRPLEERFARPAELPEQVDGIIVLGGTVVPWLSAQRGEPALSGTAERFTVFAALARRFPDATLVFTGGSGDLLRQEAKEAGVAARVFADIGLPLERVVLEGRSRNTYENALLSLRLVEPGPSDTWLLVTSARHMPRSVGVFRALGWPVVPVPTDYLTGTRPFPLRFGLLDGLALTEAGVREWIGLVAYRLAGRTDALLPAPP